MPMSRIKFNERNRISVRLASLWRVGFSCATSLSARSPPMRSHEITEARSKIMAKLNNQPGCFTHDIAMARKMQGSEKAFSNQHMKLTSYDDVTCLCRRGLMSQADSVYTLGCVGFEQFIHHPGHPVSDAFDKEQLSPKDKPAADFRTTVINARFNSGSKSFLNKT